MGDNPLPDADAPFVVRALSIADTPEILRSEPGYKPPRRRKRKKAAAGKGKAPACAECATSARVKKVTGAAIYPHRPDLRVLPFWRCACGAYCGCHPGTSKPLGFPCGPETRRARSAAHAAFDPLWKRKAEREGISKSKARGAGYRWLADKLGIDKRDCHIGMMDAETARRVVAIIEKGAK